MGEVSLGAAVGARVLGVLGLASRSGRGLPPAPGLNRAAGGRSALALLRRDLVALRVGSLLERGDRALGELESIHLTGPLQRVEFLARRLVDDQFSARDRLECSSRLVG